MPTLRNLLDQAKLKELESATLKKEWCISKPRRPCHVTLPCPALAAELAFEKGLETVLAPREVVPVFKQYSEADAWQTIHFSSAVAALSFLMYGTTSGKVDFCFMAKVRATHRRWVWWVDSLWGTHRRVGVVGGFLAGPTPKE